MKVSVDSSRCQGHTLCAMIAPDSFELSDIDGSSSPVNEIVPAVRWRDDGDDIIVPADQEEAVREAAHSCPEQAISIEE